MIHGSDAFDQGRGWSPRPWSIADLPDLSGTRAVVTGVTSGIGTPTAAALAAAGAEVILLGRSEPKVAATRESLQAAVPAATFREVIADLADLSSVRAAGQRLADFGTIDLLVNNAGVLTSTYQTTADGCEIHMATNHFGPFLLTATLLDQLAGSGNGRVVTVSSLGHRLARRAPSAQSWIGPKHYSMVAAYGASKLANLLFAFELDRRLNDRGIAVRSLAAHPGYSATDLAQKMGRWTGRVCGPGFRVLGQPVENGALPTLMAATAPLPGGTYIGPRGFGQVRGLPRIVTASKLAYDRAAAAALWDLSESVVNRAWL